MIPDEEGHSLAVAFLVARLIWKVCLAAVEGLETSSEAERRRLAASDALLRCLAKTSLRGF